MATIIIKRGTNGGVTIDDDTSLPFTIFGDVLIEEYGTNMVRVGSMGRQREISIADTLTINDVAYTQTTVAALQNKLRDEVFFKLVNSVDDFRITGSTLNRWYTSPVNNTALTTVNAGAGVTIFAIPFVVTKRITVDQMALEVTTLGTGANQRVGIYADDGNGYPGALVVDAGTISATSTGVKTYTTGLPLALNPGLYWLVTSGNGTSTVIRGIPVASMMNILGFAVTLGSSGGMGWQAAFTYAALPATFPTASAAVITTAVPAIWVRLSA